MNTGAIDSCTGTQERAGHLSLQAVVAGEVEGLLRIGLSGGRSAAWLTLGGSLRGTHPRGGEGYTYTLLWEVDLQQHMMQFSARLQPCTSTHKLCTLDSMSG